MTHNDAHHHASILSEAFSQLARDQRVGTSILAGARSRHHLDPDARTGHGIPDALAAVLLGVRRLHDKSIDASRAQANLSMQGINPRVQALILFEDLRRQNLPIPNSFT